MSFHRLCSLLFGVVLVLSVGACTTTPEAGTDSEVSSEFPMRFDNCGMTVELDTAPERIVTIKSSTTEMLLALGAGEQILGRAFPDGPIPDQWTQAASHIELISDRLPNQEALLDLEPDFVYAGWESNVTSEGVGERDSLSAMGVNSYVSASACQGENQPEKLTFDLVFEEIEEVGRWSGHSAEADDLVTQLRKELDELDSVDQPLRTLWFSSGNDVPFVGAGIGAPQMIMEAAGLENIAGEVKDTWTPMSWEAIIDSDPEVIVLIDSDWGSTEKKISEINSNPAVANVTAVKNQRYVVVPFAAAEAGVRNVEAVRTILEQLNS